jgi:uncharacterized protein (UPF0261 family)
VLELDANINEPVFADRAIQVFLELSAAMGEPIAHLKALS